MQEVFYEKTVNNFLNSEQKIIYARKRVNNFLNNAEQKIILCRMLEIILCYLFLCLCLFVDYPKNCKELELGELEYLRKTIPSILFTKNLSLVGSSSILQGTWVYQARIPHFFFYCTNSRLAAPRWNETRNSSLLKSSTI